MIKLLSASLTRRRGQLKAAAEFHGRMPVPGAIASLGRLAQHLLGTAHQIGAKAGLSPKQVEQLLYGHLEKTPLTEHTEPTEGNSERP